MENLKNLINDLKNGSDKYSSVEVFMSCEQSENLKLLVAGVSDLDVDRMILILNKYVDEVLCQRVSDVIKFHTTGTIFEVDGITFKYAGEMNDNHYFTQLGSKNLITLDINQKCGRVF